jgi:hypothetical protein
LNVFSIILADRLKVSTPSAIASDRWHPRRRAPKKYVGRTKTERGAQVNGFITDTGEC